MSLAREHLRRVAGEVGGRLVGTGAVVGLVLAAAGAAVVLAALERGLQRRVAQLGRDQLELARAAGAGEREGVRVDADARGRAERVVDAGVAEVVEPAEQVGRVGPEERELGRVALERVLRGLERAVALLAVGVDLARGDVAQRLLQAAVSSIRSFAAPGRLTIRERSLSVGRASRASGRSSARNGRSFLATGLDSSTSGSRSSSAARRLTNVVLARRWKPGRRPIDSASASFWLPIAVVVVASSSTRPARSSRRSAMSVTSWEEETMKRSSSGVSRLSSRNSRLEAASDGLR